MNTKAKTKRPAKKKTAGRAPNTVHGRREHHQGTGAGDRVDARRERERPSDVDPCPRSRCARGPYQDGPQPGAVRDQVRFPAGHTAQLGTGPRASGYADAGAARGNRKASRGGRGRPSEGELIAIAGRGANVTRTGGRPQASCKPVGGPSSYRYSTSNEGYGLGLAERGRFELPVPVKVLPLSRRARSTTLPPLRVW